MGISEPISFIASFPSIQSAIKVYGNLEGMRIQLEIPESEMAEAVQLLALRGVAFRVTIGRVEQEKANRAEWSYDEAAHLD